jgi:hypothetical protein
MIPRASGRNGVVAEAEQLPGVHLVRTAERVEEVEALAERLGGRVGLAGVLADLNRSARPARVPGRAVHWGFRWDEEDQRSRRWWPQGITTSADAAAAAAGEDGGAATGEDGSAADPVGRPVVVTSAYSKRVDGYSKGARLSFVDVSDRTAPRYRHVLLVEPVLTHRGVDLRPVPVHAGGIVWHGRHLHVAGTRRGIATFRLEDLVALPRTGDPRRLGSDGPRGAEIHGFGYRYLLPLRFGYEAVTPDAQEQLRYSFLSLDRSSTPYQLIAGEYGTGAMTTRLLRYAIDPSTGLLRTDGAARSHPLAVEERGVGHTQGATVVGGRWYLTTSAGRYRLGSVWTGTPGDLRRHRFATPAGVEDLTYWPATDELWSLSEHPGHRYVFAMPRARLDGLPRRPGELPGLGHQPAR